MALRRMDRRTFLHGATAATAALMLRNSASARTYQANEKLDIALIGVGGRGEWFVDTIPQMENVVAVCDVDDQRAARSLKKLAAVPRYYDYRKMLEERKSIDAVIVAAPDHIHAPASVMAMKFGKHVYCEKPLTNRVWESRVMRETAAQCKVATQMGNQGTASEPFRRAVELIQGGAIGEIQEVHAWNDSGGAGRRELPQGAQSVPPHLRWDLWLGPAADRPYHPAWLTWHAWRDFGTGQLGNWASHTMNLAFKSLKLDTLWKADTRLPAQPAPRVAIQAEVSETNDLSFPRWEVICYDFPARDELKPIRVHWYNGSSAPNVRKRIEQSLGRRLDWGDAGEGKWADFAGLLIIGTKGMLHSTGHNASFSLLPEAQFKDFQDPPHSLPRSPGHEQEWIQACKGGPPAMSNFVDYGAAMAEFVLLGNVATQFKERIEYDPLAGKVVNSPGADAALRREYRQGWSL